MCAREKRDHAPRVCNCICVFDAPAVYDSHEIDNGTYECAARDAPSLLAIASDRGDVCTR